MKEVIAIVRPFLAEKVLEALRLAPLEACTVREVKGYGRQKSYLDQYGDSEYSLAFLPKVEIDALIATIGSPEREAQNALAREVTTLIHGEAATYQVGWTSDTGRDLHAHSLILWKGIEELRERGVRKLDLGGVNTTRSAGIARFKMSTGGQVLTCAGTFI